MARRLIKKMLLTVSLACVLTMTLAMVSFADQETQVTPGIWEQTGTEWRFKGPDGAYAKSQWVYDTSGKWYYMREDGIMLRSAWTPDGNYVDKDGVWLEGYTGTKSTDAWTVYNEMAARTAGMSDMNAYLDMSINMSAGMETLAMRLEMNMRANHMTDPNLMKFLVYMRAAVDDEQMTMSVYYEDGYAYIDMGGIRIKGPLDMAAALETAMKTSNMFDHSQNTDLIKDLSLRAEGEYRVLTYTMDDAKMNAYMRQVWEMMGLYLYQDMDINIHDIKGAYIVNQEGYYVKATIQMNMDLTVEGETVRTVITGDIGIDKPGESVEVTPVVPLSEFTDLYAGTPAA